MNDDTLETDAALPDTTIVAASPAKIPPGSALDAKFQGLLESAPDAIVITNDAGQIVIINRQAERLFGYDRAALIGQPIETLLPERLRERHLHHRADYLAAPRTRPMGSGLNLLARRSDGNEFPVEISLSPLQTAEGQLITSVIRDSTARHQAAAELERQVQHRTAHLNALLQFSKELLETRGLDIILQRALNHALALLPEAQCGAIYLADPAGQRLALRASAGFQQLPAFNRPIALGLIGRAFTTRQAQVASSYEEWRMLAAEGNPAVMQQLQTALNLSEPPTGLLALPLLTHNQVIGAIVLLRTAGTGPFAVESRASLDGLANLTAAAIQAEQSTSEAAALSHQLAQLAAQQQAITERLNAAEAGMLQAARLAAVGQLAASIAHEINNPLYAARNCLYLIETDPSADPRASPYLQIARDQLTRIAGIIARMREFYRPSRGELEPHQINELIEDTLALAGLNTRYSSIHVIFTPDADLSPVLCNGDQIRQVLLNLILNAIEAMADGGTLTVRTIAGPTVAVIEVQDTGVGIPADVRARLFEPFFTTKPTGTGLGLSISAHIVTQHGGQIEVVSAPGQGSTFRIALSYQPRSASDADQVEAT